MQQGLKAHREKHRKSLPSWIRVLAALCIVVCLAVPAAAKMNPMYVNPSGYVYGGEPGEDPHLRLPVIVKMRDDGYVTAPTDMTDRSMYPIESLGGECFGEGSRVQDVWDLVFRMLFDVLPR